jgi:hypothetical protein
MAFFCFCGIAFGKKSSQPLMLAVQAFVALLTYRETLLAQDPVQPKWHLLFTSLLAYRTYICFSLLCCAGVYILGSLLCLGPRVLLAGSQA